MTRLRAPDALLAAIAEPGRLRALDATGWEALLSCARRNGVLAYLGSRTEVTAVLPHLPESARGALISAQLSAARIGQLALWELDRVGRVLQPAGIPMLALKGVAYLLRRLPHATTRRMSDIDVMVRKESLADAEQALRAGGWTFANVDPYDQKYYRTWSHELPPLHFPGRTLSVDVHHTICPPLSRLRPDPEAFWAASETCDDSGVRVMCQVDTVLHAAVHLFFDSDFDGRFRDLVDLHELLLAFGGDDDFWHGLIDRAGTQGVGRPVYLALETLVRVLGTPVPVQARRQAAKFKPPFPIDHWMTRVLDTVLRPTDPEPWPPPHGVLLWLLYARSHWLRLPPHLLLPHLLRKSFRRGRRINA
jgi:hypothetical protein